MGLHEWTFFGAKTLGVRCHRVLRGLDFGVGSVEFFIRVFRVWRVGCGG